MSHGSRWALVDDSPDAATGSSGTLRIVPAAAPWRLVSAKRGGWYKQQGVIWDASLGALVWLRAALQAPQADEAPCVDLHTASRAMRILEEAAAVLKSRAAAEARRLRRLRHWNVGAMVVALVAPGAEDGLRGAWWSADATAFEELGPLRAQVSALVRSGRLFVAQPPWTQMAQELRDLRGAARSDRLGQQVQDLLGDAPGAAQMETLLCVATGDYGGALGGYRPSGGIDIAELARRVQGERWQRDAALFGVAGTARAARALRAWERVAQASKGGGDDDE